MIKRTVVATIGVLALATGGAYAAGNNSHVDASLHNMQMQINQLKDQLAHGGKSSHASMGGLVSTNAKLTSDMLSSQRGVDGGLTLLKAREHGELNHGVTIGGQVKVDAIAQHRNTAAKTADNWAAAAMSASNTGSNGSDITVSDVDLQTIAAINNWTTGYVNLVRIPAINSAKYAAIAASALRVNEAYVVFGNLHSNPVYGLIGRNNIDFGSFASVNSYFTPLNRVLFQANGNVAEVGYHDYGFTATVSAMNGGTQNTVVSMTGNIPVLQNLSTANTGNIQNFAMNVHYTTKTSGVNWTVGGGLLRGTQFNSYNGDTNGAWDVNGKVAVANFDVLGEFTRTFHKTQMNSHVNAWQIAGQYNFPLMGHKSDFSVGYSAMTGDSNVVGTSTNSVNAQQYAVGLNSEVFKNVNAGLEYGFDRDNASANGSSGYQEFNTIALDVTAMF